MHRFGMEKPNANPAAATPAGMGRPIPYFPQAEQGTVSAPAQSSDIRRPPPLNLSDIPDDATYEWFASYFTRFYRLLKQAEEAFPLLAQYHRSIAEALTDTPTPRGPIVWEEQPNLNAAAPNDAARSPRVRFA